MFVLYWEESVFGSAGLRAHHNSFSLIQHYSQERHLLILYAGKQEGLIAHQAKLDVLSTTGDFCSFFLAQYSFPSTLFLLKGVEGGNKT